MWQARKPNEETSFTVTDAFKAAFERCGYVVTKVAA